MKPSPQRDFPVSGGTFASQSPPEIASHLDDACWLLLNNTVTVAFVGAVDPAHLRLPLVDEPPRDAEEALGEIVYGERYVVTSSASRDGDAERIVGQGELEGLNAAFFYVAPARFAELCAGVLEIAERTGGAIPSHLRASELGTLPVLDYVRRVIVESPLLGDYERALLGPAS